MTRATRTFQVTVSAPPSGSSLSALAASMTAGTWAQLNTTGLNAAILVGLSTGNMIPYTNCGAWDPVHKKAHILGQDARAGAFRHITFDDATTAWTTTFADVGFNGGHGYDHLVCDPNTGDLYSATYGSAPIAKWTYGAGSWDSSWKAKPSGSNITFGTCWWSGALVNVTGSQGALVIHEAAFGQIWVLDIQTGSWVTNDQSPVALSPGYHNLAAYSAQNNCMVFGGGNNYGKQLWRYSSNGVITQYADAPTPGPNIGIQQGTLSEDPVTGRMLILTQSQLWELNPATGAYVQQTGSRVPPAEVNTCDDTSNANCVIPISTYGVTMVVSADGASSSNTYLYKHA